MNQMTLQEDTKKLEQSSKEEKKRETKKKIKEKHRADKGRDRRTSSISMD